MDLALEKIEYGEALDEYIRQFLETSTEDPISSDIVITMDDGSDLFAFNQDAIYREVSLLTLYTAQTISDADGLNQLDQVHLSDTEKAVFYPFLRKVIFDIYRKVSALGRNITGSVKYNVDIDTQVGKFVAFNIRFSEAFEENMKDVILQDMHEALISGISAQWYKLRRMYEEEMVQKLVFDESLLQIKRDSMYRKVPLRRKSSPF